MLFSQHSCGVLGPVVFPEKMVSLRVSFSFALAVFTAKISYNFNNDFVKDGYYQANCCHLDEVQMQKVEKYALLVFGRRLFQLNQYHCYQISKSEDYHIDFHYSKQNF